MALSKVVKINKKRTDYQLKSEVRNYRELRTWRNSFLKSSLNSNPFRELNSFIAPPTPHSSFLIIYRLLTKKKLSPISLAVLMFIGYKRTDKQTNRQA